MNQEQTDYWYLAVYPDMYVCKACGAVVPGIEHYPDLHVKFHQTIARALPYEPQTIYDQERHEFPGNPRDDAAPPPGGRVSGGA